MGVGDWKFGLTAPGYGKEDVELNEKIIRSCLVCSSKSKLSSLLKVMTSQS